jgi:uncharacterized protein
MSEIINLQNIATQLSIKLSQVEKTLELLDSGATIPFISRYRKEITGSLDEVQVAQIRDLAESARELEKRRTFVLKTIKEQGVLSPPLEAKINKASTLTELEDIYLPYKPKRRTKATIAREKGLEPLAKQVFDQKGNFNAESFVNEAKDVKSAEEALQGARDIIAEWVNENQESRGKLRNLFVKQAVVKTKVMTGKKEEGEKYKDYFEWDELLSKAPSHRILAMRRGEKENILSMDISPEKEDANQILAKLFVEGNGKSSNHVQLATEDAYKRLMKPSLETEMRLDSKKRADEQAIKVFADNLRELLLASPLGQKAILAIDPGFRTGCKVVALDPQGKLLANTNIYPNEPQNQIRKSDATIQELVKKHNIEAIAIGNGTAGRETEAIVQKIDFGKPVSVIMVNESGASIYSASAVAREEFPDHDITVRGSVSIGRRLADPLAELVKLDAKSIGVGQYQHDVDQNALKTSLDDVVSSCVNQVGVELNTASKELLTYVSGLGPQLAENIIAYRNENGAFSSRVQLKKVKRMGAKAFEQAAGFLRIHDSKNPLDTSAVHPESYHIVKKMAEDQNCKVADLMTNAEKRKGINLRSYISETIGLPTLQDIVNELDKPGRDPRAEFKSFSFTEGVNEIADLYEGMKLPGIVTNVTNFGAFVDVGVHQDGLVHISELANKFVSDPNTVVKVQQHVEVTVKEVDVKRKRIALSMKNGEAPQPSRKKRQEDKPKLEGDFQSKMNALKGKFGG